MYMKFYEKLYTLRKGANMTQTDLAEKLGVSRQAVSRWEMGAAMPDIDNLIAMSDLFRVSLDELLKDQTKQTQSGSKAEEEGEGAQGADDSSFDKIVNWMRVDMILIAVGIISLLYSALLSSLFATPLASVVAQIGIGMLVFSIPLTIVLVIVVKKDKKREK